MCVCVCVSEYSVLCVSVLCVCDCLGGTKDAGIAPHLSDLTRDKTFFSPPLTHSSPQQQSPFHFPPLASTPPQNSPPLSLQLSDRVLTMSESLMSPFLLTNTHTYIEAEMLKRKNI